MTLAITADVRRWLDETDASAPGTVLQPFLDAAEELIKEETGRAWDTVGPASETFPSVRQGDVLKLGDESPTGLTVTVYLTPADSGRQLAAAEYSLAPHGRLRLRYDAGQFTDRSLGLLAQQQRRGLGEALASIDARPVTYERAVVAYTASGEVPARVREATACTAAALYRQRGQAVAGIESEKMGDYSYTRRKGSESPDDAIPPEALALLGKAKAPAQVIF